MYTTWGCFQPNRSREGDFLKDEVSDAGGINTWNKLRFLMQVLFDGHSFCKSEDDFLTSYYNRPAFMNLNVSDVMGWEKKHLEQRKKSPHTKKVPSPTFSLYCAVLLEESIITHVTLETLGAAHPCWFSSDWGWWWVWFVGIRRLPTYWFSSDCMRTEFALVFRRQRSFYLCST